MAFATYTDIEGRWRTLTSEEKSKATALLEDAAIILKERVTVVDGDEDQAKMLNMVSCNMVIRALLARASDAFGVDQVSATMGPFAQTAHYSNPNGNLYLTKDEKRLLGTGGGKGRMLHPACGMCCDD